MEKDSKPLQPDVRIGHVHLKVADLGRGLSVYRDVLGLELTQRYGRHFFQPVATIITSG